MQHHLYSQPHRRKGVNVDCGQDGLLSHGSVQLRVEEKFARDLGASEYIDGSKTSHHEALQKVGPNPAIRGDLQNGLELFGKLLLLLRMTFLQSSILL